MFPQSRGWLVANLVKLSLARLVLCYLVVVLLESLLFSLLHLDGTLLFSKEHQNNFFSKMYYVVTAHYTVGFGDIHPIGLGKLLFVVHSAISYLVNTLFVGVIVVKLIWPYKIMRLSKYVAFDKNSGRFEIALYNMHYFSIVNVGYKLFLTVRRKSIKRNSYTPTTYTLKLGKDCHPSIARHNVIFVSTATCSDEEKPSALTHSPSGFVLHPGHINKNSKLRFIISGNFEAMGGQSYYQVKIYAHNKIVCGTLGRVRSYDENGEVSAIRWDRFGAVKLTAREDCKECQYQDSCNLQRNNAQYKGTAYIEE